MIKTDNFEDMILDKNPSLLRSLSSKKAIILILIKSKNLKNSKML